MTQSLRSIKGRSVSVLMGPVTGCQIDRGRGDACRSKCGTVSSHHSFFMPAFKSPTRRSPPLPDPKPGGQNPNSPTLHSQREKTFHAPKPRPRDPRRSPTIAHLSSTHHVDDTEKGINNEHIHHVSYRHSHAESPPSPPPLASTSTPNTRTHLRIPIL